MKHRTLYTALVAGTAIGLVASFLQLLEKLVLLKNSGATLSCNLSSVFSCTNVLNAWQSSVFGFPNSLLCVVLFAFILGIGLVGLTGGTLGRGVRLAVQGLSLFFLGFGLWFLWQSTFVIHAICIYCLFCFGALFLINGSILRLNAADLPFGRRRMQQAIENGVDIIGWVALVAIVAAAMILQFS